MLSSLAYRSSLSGYGVRDGVRALVLYVGFMALLVVQGYLYTTPLPLGVIASLNIVSPLLATILTLGVLLLRQEKLASVGITRRAFWPSCGWGLALAVLLIAGVCGCQLIVQRQALSLGGVSGTTIVICLVGAVNEELGFRGYIETRLAGLVRSGVVCSLLTACLFLLVHYPVYWGISGVVSFSGVTPLRVVCILLLHFLCDFVYRRTNCLWGAMLLHWAYNVGSGLVFVG